MLLAAIALSSAQARAAEISPAEAQSTSISGTNTVEGPKRLKEEVRITVETNALPTAATNNKAKPKQKSTEWKFFWEDWNGLHYDLSTKTRLTNSLAAAREKIEGTNAYRIFHLEEVKMSGKFGVKLMVDGAAFVTSQDFTDFDNGFQVRRARIYTMGDCILLLPVSYDLEIGLNSGQFYIENTYLLFRDIPWIGNLQFGQYQAPMGLDNVTSSRDITYMEAAAPLEALTPGTSAGVEIGQPIFNQRATWTLGLFAPGSSQDSGDASKNYGRAITRLTGLPIYQVDPEHPDSQKLLHLGLSANVLYSSTSSVRYRTRPESHIAPYVIDTGNIDADGALVTGAEAAWVDGPFSVQGEFYHSWVRELDGQVPEFYGFYGSVSWFLTGESRPYDRINGCFARVIPRHNFNWGKGGWGAWEVAGRYSYTDLESQNIHGGRLSMLMTDLTWYLHSHVKWLFEYGYGHVSDRQPEGSINIFQMRMEVDF